MRVADDPLWGRDRRIVPLKRDESAKTALWIDSSEWVEEQIPKRPWIAKGYLLRGHVSVLAGGGAAGKSMLSLGYAVSLALMVPWGRFVPIAQCRISLVNAEDDADEQKLRLSAVLRQHGAASSAIAGRIARIGFSTAAPLVDFDPTTGLATRTAAMDELAEHIRTFKPDVVVVDPLVELHNANENDNQALRAVVAAFRDIAREYDCAVLIVHHARKGSSAMAGDPDMIRGAGAIVGAARVALTCCPMTQEEASELGISDEARRYYFRVDGAKSNYAPLRDAEWYERVEYVLDNDETVSAAVPWAPPKHEPTADEYLRLLDAVATARMPLSPRLSDEARSFAMACRRIGIEGRDLQKKALATLKATHGVVEASFTRPGKGKGDTATGLRTADGMPAHVPWEDH